MCGEGADLISANDKLVGVDGGDDLAEFVRDRCFGGKAGGVLLVGVVIEEFGERMGDGDLEGKL